MKTYLNKEVASSSSSPAVRRKSTEAPISRSAALQHAVGNQALLRMARAASSARTVTPGQLLETAMQTGLGKKYVEMILASGKELPIAEWGKGKFRAYYDAGGNKIVLNEGYAQDESGKCATGTNCLKEAEWHQVVTLELGNAAHTAIYAQIRADAKAGRLGKKSKAFVNAMEKVEFDIRMEVIHAYEAGEFCALTDTNCISAFQQSVRDFETYIESQDGKKHRQQYVKEWNEMGAYEDE